MVIFIIGGQRLVKPCVVGLHSRAKIRVSCLINITSGKIMYLRDVNERGMVEDGEVKRQCKFRKSRKPLSVSKQASFFD